MAATESEAILARFATSAFLSPWSYSNPYNDKKQHGKGSGKEICDFLVVFGAHILVFSDKHVDLKESVDLDVAWKRWYRDGIKESFDQIRGAERWIEAFPSRVYADRDCTTPLEVSWPTSPRIHRIVVVRGAAQRAWVEKGTTSLAVTSEVFSPTAKPFVLCQPSGDAFCHIFEEKALGIVLDFLDTAPDFIAYLCAKEGLFANASSVYSPSEQDLLANYIDNLDADEQHCFPPTPPGKPIVVEAGQWDRFQQSEQHAAWKQANPISYEWDRIVERFYKHHIAGTQYFLDQTNTTPEIKELLRFLADRDRFQRRVLSEKILELVGKIDGEVDFRLTSVVVPKRPPHVFFGLLVLSELSYCKDYESFRIARRRILECLAFAIKHVHPQAEDIVCLGIDSTASGQSEDALYLDAREWGDDERERARSCHEDGGLLKKTQQDSTDRWEFPVKVKAPVAQRIIRKQGRNERCQCGSGKKFKNCCLRSSQ